MKKTIMCVIGAMMIVSLAACTPTSEKNKTGEVKQTEAKNSVSDKQPDPTAPELDVVSIYGVSDDGNGLIATMDSVEQRTPQILVDLLIAKGVLPEGTEAISFEAEGKSAEVGPGVMVIPGIEIESTLSESGVLNLSQLPSEGADKDRKIQAVANTFLENMNVVNLTIQVNGESVDEVFVYVDPAK